jgi:cytochrome c
MRNHLDSRRAASSRNLSLAFHAAILPAWMLLIVSAVPQARADTAALPVQLIEKHCNACHAVNDRLIGPPLLAVAARYGADADPQRRIEVLAEKIRLGGAGNWGIVPMVPNTELTAEQARALVRLILAIKPQT